MGPGQRRGRPLAGALLVGAACLITVGSLVASGCAGGSDDRVGGDEGRRSVVFLTDRSPSDLGPEASAAFEALEGLAGVTTQVVQFQDLPRTRIPPTSVAWWHHGDTDTLPSAAVTPAALAAVRRYLAGGGHVLLTLVAASYVVPLGLETQPPDRVGFVSGDDYITVESPDDRHLAGPQSYRGHPALRRFWGGTYTSTPRVGVQYPVARYTGDRWPETGRVWAVLKSYIDVDPTTKIGVEYSRAETGSAGHVVTLGDAFTFSSPQNQNRIQLSLLLQDLLTYLTGDLPPDPPGAQIATTGATGLGIAQAAPAAPQTPATDPLEDSTDGADLNEIPTVLRDTTFWNQRLTTTRAFVAEATAAAAPGADPAILESVTAARSGLALERQEALDEEFHLAAPRILAIGQQRGVVREVWAYPYRILTDLRLAVIDPATGVRWLNDDSWQRTFIARPEGHTIRLEDGEISVQIHLAVASDRPALLVLVDVDAPGPLRLVATWNADQRVMWPREESHLGHMEIGWDDGARAAIWRDGEGVQRAVAGFGRDGQVLLGMGPDGTVDLPLTEVSTEELADGDPLAGGGVALQIDVDPARDAVVPFVVVAAQEGDPDPLDTYRGLLADPASLWAANASRWREFLADTLDLRTPDPTFDEAFRWAKVGIESFRVTTPGLGTGLVAGFGASADTGWAPARPGYGWYFGRDAIWTALAADAYGGFDLTEDALRLLARYRDVDGKILHEMSPSWAIHYDAADSTPLFLVGLENHVRATGDRDLLRALWPTVLAAVEFLFSTDTDGDGLIENTNVGHGWIEGGRLYGAHTTFYLAGVWAAALGAVENLATWAGDTDLAERCRATREQVVAALGEDFWDPDGRTYYYGKNADGTFKSARTVLPAVPMTFGLLDEGKVTPILDLLASSEMTTDWGTRMVERSNPSYSPTGYHYGSVWPLFTGWASLAEFAYHRTESGFQHLASNLRLYRHGNLGAVDEVLNGDVFLPAGVCSHQAWSEAMGITPAVRGMLGIVPDAMEGTLRIIPQLPGGWDRVVATQVHVGDDSFEITIDRGRERTAFTIERLVGSRPVRFEIGIPVPHEILINLDRDATTGVAIQGQQEIIRSGPVDKVAVVFAVLTESGGVVTFRHGPFPRVIPVVPSVEPGDESSGLRLVQSSYRSRALAVRVEALPGRVSRLQFDSPWEVAAVTGIPGALVTAPGPGRAAIEFTVPGTGTSYQRAELRIEFRR